MKTALLFLSLPPVMVCLILSGCHRVEGGWRIGEEPAHYQIRTLKNDVGDEAYVVDEWTLVEEGLVSRTYKQHPVSRGFLHKFDADTCLERFQKQDAGVFR